MSDGYRVELKDSLLRETPLTEDEFDRQIEFSSEADAEEWGRQLTMVTCLTRLWL